MSINNKRSYTEYTVTQPTTDFAIGFDDFDEGGKDNILVTLNGVLVESLGYAAIRKNESTVTITPAITEGTVRLTRETDIDEPFHKFTAGALFSAKSMDENFQQVRHSQQEVRDGFVFLEYNTNGIVQASKEATAEAKVATVEATASAVRAETAADTAVQAVGSLQGVVNAATTATTKANAATATATTAASQATAATTSAQNAAQAANTAKQEAATAAANANAATVDTLAATGRANEAADVVADLVVGKVRAQDVSTTEGRTQLDKNRESVSILDFFTEAELAAFEADKTTFDAYRPIQEFFTYIAQNDVGTARADISAYISTGITMGISGNNETKLVVGNMHLTAMNAIDTMIMTELGNEFQWVGEVALTGHRTATSPPYAWRNRTCRVGMGTSTIAVGLNARQTWGRLRMSHFQEDGLQVTAGTSSNYYHHIRNGYCGVYAGPDSRYRFDTTFNNRVDTGASSTGSQRSTITVAEMPPITVLDSDRPCLIYIDSEFYLVLDYSVSNSSLSVYPWIDLTKQSGMLSYVFGASVSVFGKDASGVYIGNLEGSVNGIGLQDSALYACSVGSMMSQASSIGVVIGAGPGAANQGGFIGSYYCEGNRADVLMLSVGAPNRVIVSSHTLTASGIHTISARSSSTNTTTGGIGNTLIRAGSDTYRSVKLGNNENIIQNLDFSKRELNGMVYSSNNQQFYMPDINIAANRLTGHDSLVFRVLGINGKETPTSVTFRQASGATATTNGESANVVFRNFAETPEFTVFGEIASNNYRVILNTRVAISTSVTLTSLEPAASNTYPVVFDGVKTSDFLVARASKPLQGTTIEASVTSKGNALITHTNNTGLAVDIGAVVIDIKSM